MAAGGGASGALSGVGAGLLKAGTSSVAGQLGSGIRSNLYRLGYENRQLRKAERQAVADLEANRLGPSLARRRQMLGEAQRVQQANAASQRADLTRREAAGMGGGLLERQALATAEQTGLAQASAGIEQAAAQQADRRRREILRLLQSERAARFNQKQGSKGQGPILSAGSRREVRTQLAGMESAADA